MRPRNSTKSWRCARNAARWLAAAGVSLGRAPVASDLAAAATAATATAAAAAVALPPKEGRLVCFPHVVAGLNALSDHCDRGHGWFPQDYDGRPCNIHRGRGLWLFREWLIRNLAVAEQSADDAADSPQLPLVLLLPRHVDGATPHALTKDDPTGRGLWADAFGAAAAALRAQPVPVDARVIYPGNLSAAEQASLFSRAAAVVADSGGNAVSGIFLPRGAALILLVRTHYANGDARYEQLTPLDWDLWHHASHLRVRWLDPTGLDPARDRREAARPQVKPPKVDARRQVPSREALLRHNQRAAEPDVPQSPGDGAEAQQEATLQRLIAVVREELALTARFRSTRPPPLGEPPPKK